MAAVVVVSCWAAGAASAQPVQVGLELAYDARHPLELSAPFSFLLDARLRDAISRNEGEPERPCRAEDLRGRLALQFRPVMADGIDGWHTDDQERPVQLLPDAPADFDLVVMLKGTQRTSEGKTPFQRIHYVPGELQVADVPVPPGYLETLPSWDARAATSLVDDPDAYEARVREALGRAVPLSEFVAQLFETVGPTVRQDIGEKERLPGRLDYPGSHPAWGDLVEAWGAGSYDTDGKADKPEASVAGTPGYTTHYSSWLPAARFSWPRGALLEMYWDDGEGEPSPGEVRYDELEVAITPGPLAAAFLQARARAEGLPYMAVLQEYRVEVYAIPMEQAAQVSDGVPVVQEYRPTTDVTKVCPLTSTAKGNAPIPGGRFLGLDRPAGTELELRTDPHNLVFSLADTCALQGGVLRTAPGMYAQMAPDEGGNPNASPDAYECQVGEQVLRGDALCATLNDAAIEGGGPFVGVDFRYGYVGDGGVHLNMPVCSSVQRSTESFMMVMDVAAAKRQEQTTLQTETVAVQYAGCRALPPPPPPVSCAEAPTRACCTLVPQTPGCCDRFSDLAGCKEEKEPPACFTNPVTGKQECPLLDALLEDLTLVRLELPNNPCWVDGCPGLPALVGSSPGLPGRGYAQVSRAQPQALQAYADDDSWRAPGVFRVRDNLAAASYNPQGFASQWSGRANAQVLGPLATRARTPTQTVRYQTGYAVSRTRSLQLPSSALSGLTSAGQAAASSSGPLALDPSVVGSIATLPLPSSDAPHPLGGDASPCGTNEEYVLTSGELSPGVARIAPAQWPTKSEARKKMYHTQNLVFESGADLALLIAMEPYLTDPAEVRRGTRWVRFYATLGEESALPTSGALKFPEVVYDNELGPAGYAPECQADTSRPPVSARLRWRGLEGSGADADMDGDGLTNAEELWGVRLDDGGLLRVSAFGANPLRRDVIVEVDVDPALMVDATGTNAARMRERLEDSFMVASAGLAEAQMHLIPLWSQMLVGFGADPTTGVAVPLPWLLDKPINPSPSRNYADFAAYAKYVVTADGAECELDDGVLRGNAPVVLNMYAGATADFCPPTGLLRAVGAHLGLRRGENQPNYWSVMNPQVHLPVLIEAGWKSLDDSELRHRVTGNGHPPRFSSECTTTGQSVNLYSESTAVESDGLELTRTLRRYNVWRPALQEGGARTMGFGDVDAFKALQCPSSGGKELVYDSAYWPGGVRTGQLPFDAVTQHWSCPTLSERVAWRELTLDWNGDGEVDNDAPVVSPRGPVGPQWSNDDIRQLLGRP